RQSPLSCMSLSGQIPGHGHNTEIPLTFNQSIRRKTEKIIIKTDVHHGASRWFIGLDCWCFTATAKTRTKQIAHCKLFSYEEKIFFFSKRTLAGSTSAERISLSLLGP
ncbi:MAG: hypothetical protein JZU65_04045, partial [Chlorobium sp.]|nr:hypothetical protein [Chlorobium sp.]